MSNKATQILGSLTLISIVFWSLFFYTKNDKINVYDDDLGYLMMQECVAENGTFNECFTIENQPHRHYNPGLPFLMASFTKYVSQNIQDFKWVNGLLMFLSLIVSFLFLRKISHSTMIATAVCLLLILNRHFLLMGLGFATEPLFYCFQMGFVALYFSFIKNKQYDNWKSILGLVFLSSAAFLTRNVGLFVLGAAIIHLLLMKQFKPAIKLGAGFFLLSLPWMWQSRMGWSQARQLTEEATPGSLEVVDWSQKATDVFINFKIYFLANFRHLFLVHEDISHFPNSIIAWVISLCILILIIAGAIKHKRLSVYLIVYLLLTLALLIGWKNFVVGFGVRYLTPFLPFFYFLILVGIYHILNKWVSKHSTKILLCFVTLIGAYQIISLPILKEATSKDYSEDIYHQSNCAQFIQSKRGEQIDVMYANQTPLIPYLSKRKYIKKTWHHLPNFADSLFKVNCNWVIANTLDTAYTSELNNSLFKNQKIKIDTFREFGNIQVLELRKVNSDPFQEFRLQQ